jgi:indolepyruvate ferredoxin oxidoreductase
MMQHLRDKAGRLRHRRLHQGYRGSPLGGYDQQLWSAKKFLEQQSDRVPARA